MGFAASLLVLSFIACRAESITMDAAFFNILQNKSYFYSDDRYFVFDHRTDGISLSEEGSLETTRPWLPLPLDAVYKSSKLRNGKIDHQVYVVDRRRYLIQDDGFKSMTLLVIPNFYKDPDAVAHDPDNGDRIFFKDRKCLITSIDQNNQRFRAGEMETQDLFRNAPDQIDAAMIIRKQIFFFWDELVWCYNVTNLPANLTEGYPKLFKNVFQDSEPTISTTLKYTSRRLVGHEIDETWTHSLYECFEFCLNMPFLACSSINFGVKEISGTHKCEINRFKENHYPQDLMSNKEFVYYNVHW